MRHFKKTDFPVSQIRRLLEPGPIVLVSSAWKGATNIMTMGWHTVMEFSPSLVGCVIAGGSHSFDLIRRSRECVINVPTVELARTAVGIGNCSGRDVDKFKTFKLTPVKATRVESAADRGVLRQSRMPASRRAPGEQVQLLHLRSGEGARRDLAQEPDHHSLSRRRRLHGVGAVDQPAQAVQAGISLDPSPVKLNRGRV